ncbi:MAG: hypothetical protein U5R48_19605 [Gammaproteobacteria bacterium]|nr:hypothetical protein [Gammaproteobacteria bacterium]
MIDAIKRRTADLGRHIDADHFGAGFGFRFGTPDDPVSAGYLAMLEKRLGKDPTDSSPSATRR